MLSTVLCLALCMPSDPATASAADLATRLFDLSPILEPRSATATGIRLLPTATNPRAPERYEDPEPTIFSADTVVDLVRNCVWSEEWEFEGRSLEFVPTEDGNFLRVTLPAARMAEVEDFLNFLTQTLNAKSVVTVDVHRVRTTTGAAPTIPADAHGVAELVQSGQLAPARTFKLLLKPGRVEHAALTQSHTYVSHFEVEIAQAAARSQPITRTIETGTAMSMRGDAMPDGRIALQYAISDSAIPTAFDSIELKTDAQFVSERGSETSSARCVVQSPTVRFATVAGTAELAKGQSIVIGALDPTAGSTEHAGAVVVIRAEEIATRGGTFPCGTRRLHVIDVGFAATTALQIPRATRDALQWTPNQEGEPQTWIEISDNRDIPFVDTAIQATGAYDAPEFYAGTHGPFIFVRTQNAQGGGGAAAPDFEALVLASLPQAPLSDLVDLKIGDGNSRTCGRVSCSSRGGLALAGTQENYVASWEIDVANNSSIAQPVTFMLPSAFAARVTSAPTTQQSRSIRVQFLGRFRAGPKVVIDSQIPLLGISHGLEFLSAAFDATRWVSPGDAIPFGEVELQPGQTAPLIAALR